MKRVLLGAPFAVLCGLLASSCSLRAGAATPALPAAAVTALAEARTLVRARPDGWRARAETAAREAARLAPDWVAPERVLDDLAREGLRGPSALARRFQAVAQGRSASALYLAGRLQGQDGAAWLQEASRLDPQFAWGQHGLAFEAFSRDDLRSAVRAGRRALELAHGSHELGFFALAVARYLLEQARPEEASACLEKVLADPRLSEPERTEVAAALARAELTGEDPAVVARGFWRAIELFEGGRLSEGEYEELGAQVLQRRALTGLRDPLRVLMAALAHGQGAAYQRLRARVLVEQGLAALARASLEEGAPLPPGPFQRRRDFERGAACEGIERWCAALPQRLKDVAGLPRHPPLRALVLAARALDEAREPAPFGDVLLAAGWFDEALSFAQGLATRAPAAALRLATDAARGQALFEELSALLEGVDAGGDVFVPAPNATGSVRELSDLTALLEAMQGAFERYHGVRVAEPLANSPRLEFGAWAALVHPGPFFSARDAREGLGEEGREVPGLAAELARLGRFGIFGQAPGGGGPDGTILRTVGGEWKEGKHLGVPFAGWVAWCEGVDIESRPGRRGSPVSGAALHEGYWVDIEGVRRDWRRLVALTEPYLAPDGALAEILAQRGPELMAGGAQEAARWMAPLGEGERVLLALLAERSGDPGQRLPFDELLDLTALHEEGHLTDRTRFLPLLSHWRAVLGFLLRYGVTPRSIAGALEYRAELVALCCANEPRLALADCLMSADSEGRVLPHGEAYHELLLGFLDVLREDRASPRIDERHYLMYQLHLLSAEDIRRVARRLAARNGMLAE